ncbi:MAG: tetratricopeptide repeat protein, partial [Candidatus Cloacimonadota bacterium]|nr:tetratricopeptide repeat protein [Candidatus Cloacimonadota bacterium]
MQTITDISDSAYHKMITDSKQYDFTSKYDFFSYITQLFSKKKLYKPKTLLIYECHYLDEYSKDFLQYLSQYVPNNLLNIVAFTRQETFTFSQKIKIDPIDKNILKQIIKEFYWQEKYDYENKSEILSNIAQGNIYIIEYILENSLKKGKKIDFNSYINEKLDFDSIYLQRIKELSETELELLILIFLMDTRATREILKKISIDADKITDKLIQRNLVTFFNGFYTVKRVIPVKKKFLQLPVEKQNELFNKIRQKLPKELRIDYCLELSNCQTELLEGRIQGLKPLHDYRSIIKIYDHILSKTTEQEKKLQLLKELGLSNLKLNEYQEASGYFRRALKISINMKKPLEEIIYLLAYSLTSMNSFSLALEIINKYSPKKIVPYYKWKLLMQKAEIYTQMENFDQALQLIEKASRLATQTEESKLRSIRQGDCKKQFGLIYYYKNEWNKAQEAFKEAEKLYLSQNYKKGLAAIYNNLGSIAMLQGNWKDAEQLFLKSLKYEEQRYNLNGISICYSNLGSLFEDQSNYTRALKYLNKALEIQKLLNDKYKITTFYYNIGITYMDNNQYEKASEALHHSLEIALKFNLFRSVDAALNCLGALYFKSGKWTKAIDYYERAIQKSKANNFKEGLCQSYNNLGELYEKRGEYALAYDFYSKSLELLSSITDDFMKAEIYGNIGSVLTHLHKFGEAYGYLVESYDFFKTLNAKDEILEGAQKQAFYFIQTRNYESANYYLETALKLAEKLKNENQLGHCYYLKALLTKNSDIDKALEYLKNSIEFFILADNNFDWA